MKTKFHIEYNPGRNLKDYYSASSSSIITSSSSLLQISPVPLKKKWIENSQDPLQFPFHFFKSHIDTFKIVLQQFNTHWTHTLGQTLFQALSKQN